MTALAEDSNIRRPFVAQAFIGSVVSLEFIRGVTQLATMVSTLFGILSQTIPAIGLQIVTILLVGPTNRKGDTAIDSFDLAISTAGLELIVGADLISAIDTDETVLILASHIILPKKAQPQLKGVCLGRTVSGAAREQKTPSRVAS